MGVKTESDTGQHQRLEDVKKLASRIMHMHYCEHDIEGIPPAFQNRFSWMGAGEQEYLSGRKAARTTSANSGRAYLTVIYGMRSTMWSVPWKTCMLLWEGCG